VTTCKRRRISNDLLTEHEKQYDVYIYRQKGKRTKKMTSGENVVKRLDGTEIVPLQFI
jgi:hypothetical protein